jgi:hypothetical protein
MHVTHLRHRNAYPLNFLGPHVAQNLRRIGFAQGKQQYGGFLNFAQFGYDGSIIHQC